MIRCQMTNKKRHAKDIIRHADVYSISKYWRRHSGSKSLTFDAGLSAIDFPLPMRSGHYFDLRIIIIHKFFLPVHLA